jgi:hypothetical protein
LIDADALLALRARRDEIPIVNEKRTRETRARAELALVRFGRKRPAPAYCGHLVAAGARG